MAETLLSPTYPGDWLKGESQINQFYSRDEIVVAQGQGILVTGTVMAQRTSDSKYVVAATGTTDGSQTATCILMLPKVIDTTLADKKAVAITSEATVMHQGLTWGPTINSPALRAAAVAQLATHGIIDRQGA